jgi:uncharacterized membrane protein (UPF0127 family)
MILAVAGCNHQVNPPAHPASGPASNRAAPSAAVPTGWPAVNPPTHLNHAQPKLRSMKVWLGTNEIATELALSPIEVGTGMMFRKEMGPDEGMLFVFRYPHRTGFYMKNTVVPLSAAYIDPEGIILEIHDLEPLNEAPVMAASDQVLYVLEMNRGWFLQHRIEPGAALRTEMGTLHETFFRNN